MSSAIPSTSTAAIDGSAPPHPHHHRRRKRRTAAAHTSSSSSVATRSVDIVRGTHGFGFTISGQQPCILSCIVDNSPADLAGLRTGDFLVAVNGLNVSKLAHEAIVQLIATSPGTIRIAIAEHYYLDSSDEEATLSALHYQQQQQQQPKSAVARAPKPKFLQHKLKAQQQRSSQQQQQQQQRQHVNHSSSREMQPPPGQMVHNNNARTASTASGAAHPTLPPPSPLQQHRRTVDAFAYASVVGYLGTIEMPKQIASSSKLQTVRSCIRKMRQEKRTPTIVLMTIRPNCLTLTDRTRTLLAKYPAARLSYVSNNAAEQQPDTRFFGLVTSAVYADGQLCEMATSAADVLAATGRQQQHNDDNADDDAVTVSNSCHVFVVDAKMADHRQHAERAQQYRVQCTQDPISNSCLEFPSSSEYIVHLIRTMYSLNGDAVAQPAVELQQPASAQAANVHERAAIAPNGGVGGGAAAPLPAAVGPNEQAISPQPSNHSEVTTTSSNSDSGIGFHNDCTNISDRILVVDFPAAAAPRQALGANAAAAAAGAQRRPVRHQAPNNALFGAAPMNVRPSAIVHDLLLADIECMLINPNDDCGEPIADAAERAVDVPVQPLPPVGYLARRRRAAAAASLSAAHSCDDMLMDMSRDPLAAASSAAAAMAKLNRSVEDVSLASSGGAPNAGAGTERPAADATTRRKSHVFLFPKSVKKSRVLKRLTKQPDAAAGGGGGSSSSFASKVASAHQQQQRHQQQQQHQHHQMAQSVEDLRYQQQQQQLLLQQQKKKCTTPHGDSLSGSLQNLCEASALYAGPKFLSPNDAAMGSACSEPDLAVSFMLLLNCMHNIPYNMVAIYINA